MSIKVWWRARFSVLHVRTNSSGMEVPYLSSKTCKTLINLGIDPSQTDFPHVWDLVQKISFSKEGSFQNPVAFQQNFWTFKSALTNRAKKAILSIRATPRSAFCPPNTSCFLSECSPLNTWVIENDHYSVTTSNNTFYLDYHLLNNSFIHHDYLYCHKF